MLLCWSQLDRVVWYRALNRVTVFCSSPINMLQKPVLLRGVCLSFQFYVNCFTVRVLVSSIMTTVEYYIFSEEFVSILVSNRLFQSLTCVFFSQVCFDSSSLNWHTTPVFASQFLQRHLPPIPYLRFFHVSKTTLEISSGNPIQSFALLRKTLREPQRNSLNY